MSTAVLMRHSLAGKGNELARRLGRLSVTTIQVLHNGGITTIERLRSTKEVLLKQHPFFLRQTELDAIDFALAQAGEAPRTEVS